MLHTFNILLSQTVYSLNHTSSVVGRDLVSNIATASNDVGTRLIASTYTQSTFISLSVWWEVVYIKLIAYSLTHTRSAVERDLVSKVATTHITSNDIVANLIASTYTQSTVIYICMFPC